MTRSPRIPTRVGRAEQHDNRFRGHTVSQMAGGHTTWSALSLAVGHRALDAREAALLDDIVVCSLAADPRIWPLKVVRLVAAYGRPVPAILAGVSSTAGGFMGWGTYAPAAQFLERVAQAPSQSAREALVAAQREERRMIPGFGVAFRARDERAAALRGCLEAREYTGAYWSTALLLEDILVPLGAPMNIAAASAAVLLDLGFAVEQIAALGPLLLLPNYLANAVEGAEQRPSILRTLPAAYIEDKTPPPRLSPRAAAKDDPKA